MHKIIIYGIIFLAFISLANAVEYEISMDLSLAEYLGLEKDASHDQILEKINSNINTQTKIIDDNFDNIVEASQQENQDLTELFSQSNQELNKLEAWFKLLKYAEDKKYKDSQNIINKFFKWLGFYNKKEAARRNTTLILIKSIKDLSNQTKSTENPEQKINLLAQLLSTTGNLTGLDYFDLQEGKNIIVFPKQPTDTSVESVLNISTIERIDHYDQESQTWLIYIPGKENSLKNLIQNKIYWIYSNQDQKVIIK